MLSNVKSIYVELIRQGIKLVKYLPVTRYGRYQWVAARTVESGQVTLLYMLEGLAIDTCNLRVEWGWDPSKHYLPYHILAAVSCSPIHIQHTVQGGRPFNLTRRSTMEQLNQALVGGTLLWVNHNHPP